MPHSDQTCDPGSLHDALEAVLRAARAAVERFGLRTAPIPADLERLAGRLGEVDIVMTSETFGGAGWERVTIAGIRDAEGQLATATVCALPARGHLRPILGVDLIGLRGRLSLVAVDLSPIDDPFWSENASGPLQAARDNVLGKLKARRLPDFAVETFSSLAIVAAAPAEQDAAVAATACGVVRAAFAMQELDPMRDDERSQRAWSRNLQWRRAELRNRKEHDALSRMFGESSARRYLTESYLPLPE